MSNESAQEFVARWKTLGPLLEEQREQDLRNVDTARALRNLAPYFADAVRRKQPTQTSGLVEAQSLFMIGRFDRGQADDVR